MAVGIYALYWADQDLIYIGQSKDLEKRKYEHFRLMSTGKHHRRIQEVYSKYGNPVFTVLEYCKISDIDIAEIAWIAEFDSLNPRIGLNTRPGGQDIGKDTTHGASKFSKEKVLEACTLLCDPTLRLQDISDKTTISTSVLSTIANQKKHTWVSEDYPALAIKMLEAVDTRILLTKKDSRDSNYYIKSPEGLVYSITNIAMFCREHSLLDTKINEVLREKRKHHCGWSKPTEKEIKNVINK